MTESMSTYENPSLNLMFNNNEIYQNASDVIHLDINFWVSFGWGLGWDGWQEKLGTLNNGNGKISLRRRKLLYWSPTAHSRLAIQKSGQNSTNIELHSWLKILVYIHTTAIVIYILKQINNMDFLVPLSLFIETSTGTHRKIYRTDICHGSDAHMAPKLQKYLFLQITLDCQ